MAEYKEQLSSVVEVPANDELVQGIYTQTDKIILQSGEYERGALLMSGSDGTFTLATSEGYASASELCISCSDVIVPEGDTYDGAEGYFTGTFLADGVKLPEGVELSAIRAVLRKAKILLL